MSSVQAPAPVPDLADLLFERFAGRRDAYGIRRAVPNAKGGEETIYTTAREGKGDEATDLPLTREVIERHLTGKEAIGVYLFPKSGDHVQFATLDVDNHGTEPLTWPELVQRTRPLVDTLRPFGGVLAVRSGGGKGIHLVLFFAEPQKAARVRKLLAYLLASAGLEEGSEGGIRAGVVEVFPKQNNAKGGKGYGNLIALPFVRQSVPLDDDLSPLPLSAAAERLAKVPCFDLPELPDDPEGREEDSTAGNNADARNVVRLDTRAVLAGVGEGGRDTAIWALACKLRGADVPADEAEALVLQAAENCQPPFQAESAREKVQRAYATYTPKVELTDTGNAAYFAGLYGNHVRYDHARKRWLIWAGHWWQPDRMQETVGLAKQAMRTLGQSAHDLADAKEAQARAVHALKSRSAKALKSMLDLAQSEHPIADAGDNWDTDPWLFGVANGVIDLRTGELRPGRPEERVTMHSPVAYDPAATCPQWERTLLEIYCGNVELVEFVQHFAGYSLTGEVSEEMLTMHHGDGNNGKSLLLKLLGKVFGMYAHTLPFTELEDWARQRVSTELAALTGKRLIVVSEANEGARINEARLKSLVSRDRLRARFLYQESFEFQPTQHYWLAFNSKPEVSDNSHGFWRRVALVPYEQTFYLPGEDQSKPGAKPADLDLERRLTAEELPGILAWAVRGCLAWQRRGLRPLPEAVGKATAEYKETEDLLGAWISERCQTDTKLRCQSSILYKNFIQWCDEMDMPKHSCMSNKRFSENMSKKFYSAGGNNKPRFFLGIDLYLHGSWRNDGPPF